MRRLLLIVTLLLTGTAQATFSIIACDPQTRACGAAVATNNLAVGASVIFASADLGALASQYETHPLHGRVGLTWLKEKRDPQAVVHRLLEQDNGFEGGTVDDRQVAMVSIEGKTACHNGKKAQLAAFSACLTSPNVSVQGNGLANDKVLKSMLSAYLSTKGNLAHRLIAALEAGQAEGGQSSGAMSSAVYVSTPDGFPFDVDLRVDAAKEPVKALRNLFNLYEARQHVIDARRWLSHNKVKAEQELTLALEKGGDWDRVVRRAIGVAESLGKQDLATRLKQKLVDTESAPQ